MRHGRRAPRRWSREWFERWRSAPVSRVVLALARTTTSAIRLLDVLPVFEGTDVLVVFAFDGDSAFSGGAEAVVRAAGWPVVPWRELRHLDHDLVLTASENTDLRPARAPVVVLPHGIGFHKLVPDSGSAGHRISGLVPGRILGRREVSLVVSHAAQRDQVAALDERMGARCVVTGDPTLDRLAASLPYRGRYRARLGVGREQRLVTVTSTWAPDGVYGANGALYRRLLAELPADEYRVAAVLHPNIPTFEGPARFAQLHGDALDSGLIQVPQDEGWHGAVVASDLVVGDHGSVGLYAVGLGIPFVLGSRGRSVVPGTPPDDLARLAPRLRPDLGLRAQVEEAIDDHKPDAHRLLAERMFAFRGEAADRLRAHLLDLLGLPVPERPALRHRVPDPHATVRGPFSHRVHSRRTGPRAVELVRYPLPAAWTRRDPPPGYLDHACWSEDDPGLPPADGNFSVAVRTHPSSRPDVEAWMGDRFLSGAVVAAAPTPEGCLVATRSGTLLHTPLPHPEPSLLASAVYTLLRANTPLPGALTVHTGPHTHTTTLCPP
ncbi:hypothetical protein LO762_10910 [Actinocorallia sp. API 0066]|uniref:hypothetical protein n=1 Tax=Actinocorallia sp. API 0066 TaxID=2896846 RepID=UPI001E492984|nr:hypothetical protein [Actinocorallia sp. API 0066]MCD0449696.1 hypothetical protein [Actinocorallia sp. API 0066]